MRMTDRLPDRESRSGARDGVEPTPAGDSSAGMPRWVKVTLIVAGILVVLVLVVLLSGGEHGPGRHMGSGLVGVPSSSSSAALSGSAVGVGVLGGRAS
jgi:hypothetical protein